MFDSQAAGENAAKDRKRDDPFSREYERSRDRVQHEAIMMNLQRAEWSGCV